MTVTSLDHLRRLGRIIFGNERDGDALIRQIFDADEINQLRHSLDFDDLQEAQGRFVSKVKPDQAYVIGGVPPTSLFEEEAQHAFAHLSFDERVAFALLQIEDYSLNFAAEITGKSTTDVWNASVRAMRQLQGWHTSVLFILSDYITSELIEESFGSDSLQQFDAAFGIDDAIAIVGRQPYQLLVADLGGVGALHVRSLIEAVDGSGTRAVWLLNPGQIVSHEAHAMGTVLVKPIDNAAFAAAIRDELYVQPQRWFPPDRSFDFSAIEDNLNVPDEALAPISAPIDAEVVADQLRLAPRDVPASAVAFEALDFLKFQHMREALAIADDVRAGNGSPRVQRRLDAVAELLAQQLTEGTVLGLAVATDALARLLPQIDEEFMPLAAADIAVFVEDLQRFANQFPVFRQFNAESSADRPITDDEEGALRSLVEVLENQPDTLVANDLKLQFGLIARARAKHAGSKISDVAWVRSISNAVKAVGRYARNFGRDLHDATRPEIIHGMSKLITTMLATGALQLLGMSLPAAFAAAVIVLKGTKKKIDEKGDSDSEKSDEAE